MQAVKALHTPIQRKRGYLGQKHHVSPSPREKKDEARLHGGFGLQPGVSACWSLLAAQKHP
eukprot:1157347-Pelagomonas_calceolata.AAC.8